MHKYQPRFHLVRASDILQLPYSTFRTYVFKVATSPAYNPCTTSQIVCQSTNPTFHCKLIVNRDIV